VKHLSSFDILSERILCPSYDEQRTIANYLDAEIALIEALIAVRSRTRDLLASRRRAVVDRAMRPDHDWEHVPVKRMLRHVEQGWSPQCDSRPADPGEWGVLKAGAANGGTFRPNENKALPANVEPLVEYEIKFGDLLVSRANTRELLASVCVVPEVRPRLLLCDKLFRLSPSPDTEPRYLAYAISSSDARRSIEAEATGTSDSMQNIGQDTIRELRIWVPRGRAEQAAVADLLDQQLADSRKLDDTMRQQIDLLHERRQALVAAAVTGQLGIP
jgi:type I restriction enzyme S subunit